MKQALTSRACRRGGGATGGDFNQYPATFATKGVDLEKGLNKGKGKGKGKFLDKGMGKGFKGKDMDKGKGKDMGWGTWQGKGKGQMSSFSSWGWGSGGSSSSSWGPYRAEDGEGYKGSYVRYQQGHRP